MERVGAFIGGKEWVFPDNEYGDFPDYLAGNGVILILRRGGNARPCKAQPRG